MPEIRPLRADEVEVRIGQVSKEGKGISLLLYKDARCDRRLLDETFGPMNWQCSYSRDNRNCTVSVWDEGKGQWVSKEDTGTESNTEAQKGLASDSFKRACFKWGLGVELYTAPFIWIKNGAGCTVKNGKCFDKFVVTDMEVDDGKITLLVICKEEYGRPGEVVFSWPTRQDARRAMDKAAPKPKPAPAPKPAQPSPQPQPAQVDERTLERLKLAFKAACMGDSSRWTDLAAEMEATCECHYSSKMSQLDAERVLDWLAREKGVSFE